MRFGLPGISSKLPADVRQFLERVREAFNGAGVDSLVTYNDLMQAGLAGRARNGDLTPPEGSDLLNLTLPPAPTGVTAVGAMTNILVEWGAPLYGHHSHTEIWASGVDDIGQRVMVGTSMGSLYAHAVGTATTRYYWVRFISIAGREGPFNAIAGVMGATSQDPAFLLSVLTGQLSTSQLVTALNSRINLIDDPDSVPGSVAARIMTETRRMTAEANASAETALRDILNGETLSTNSFAAIESERVVRAGADSALASDITTLNTTIGDRSTSVQTIAQSIDGVTGQYMVKIDNNGYMSGFGLMSSLIDGAPPLSQFFVSADQFAIIAPGRTGGTLASVPFAVITTNQTINGVAFTPGVYIDGASINTGTIGTAQIGNLAVDTAKIADASIVNAKIQDAAITTAKIADASIVSAKILDATITTAKIGTAQINTAHIIDGNITNAKIGDLAVNTLQIAGNAVTIPAAAYNVNQTTINPAISVAITTQGTSPVYVTVCFSALNLQTYTRDVTVKIVRDNDTAPVTVYESAFTLAAASGTYYPRVPCTAAILDYPVAGAHTYDLVVSGSDGISHRSIFALQVKK